MQSKATTVEQYLRELPEDRREALQAVRRVILANLPQGYAEGMQYGMIGYYVPHSVYAPGYHCDPKQPLPFAGLASQKSHMSLYLMCVYGDSEFQAWFRAAWSQSGKKLDMGKSCIRFKKLDDLPLDVIGQAFKRVPTKQYIEFYESMIKGGGGQRASRATTTKSPAKATRGTKKAAPKQRPRRQRATKPKRAD